MHRLTLGRSLIIAAAVVATAGCGPKRQQVPDPPRVETIRLQIAKVRNAISETRETIANSRGATYLPELYVRLAELLSEEARYHYRLAYEREQRSSKVLHVPQVRLLKEKSIEIYELVLTRFPDTELAPRALFNIGHEHRELGNFDDMRKAYQRLVDDYKDSALRYDALLVLGDNYFDSNKLELSKGYYEQIAAGPLVKVSGLGHYKLAWVWVNQGNCDKALTQFETAIKRSQKYEDRQRARALVEAERQAEESAENPSEVEGLTNKPNTTPVAGTQQEIDVRRESLVDLSYCYSRKRNWKKVLTYLQRLSYDRDTYVASLGRMASRYRTMDNYPAAILVTRELLTLASTDEDRLDDARTLYTAVKRQKDFKRIDDDTALIVNALVRAYTRIDFTDEERATMLEEFEGMVRDLATTSQEAMNKLKKERKKVAQANKLAQTYQLYFNTFPKTEATADMLLNMTEVLDVAGYPLLAGQRSLEAAAFIAGETERKNALYDAIVYFQESLSKEFDRTQYQRVTARAALRRAADQLLAYELEPDKLRRVKYAVAQTYYDEGRFAQAIDKLSAVAYEFPGTEQGDAAIQLVLDSYNTVNDNDGLMQAARRFMLDTSPATDGLKGKIKTVLAAAETRKLDELSLQAAGDEGGDLTALLDFAAKQKGTSLGERALINAFVAARAIGDTDKMYTLADELAKDYPQSEQLPGIYTTLAQTAVARFEYDRAVQILARAASVNESQRTQLVTATGQLLQQLGRAGEAEKLYMEVINSATGGARSEALGSLAGLLETQGNASQLVSKLTPFIDDGNPELLARLGLAMISQGKADEAEMLLQSVLDGNGSEEAAARAHYGMAEVLMATLEQYPDPDSVDLIQEFIAIVEVTQQSYLNAARQGSPAYTAAALSRLGFSLQYSADRLGRFQMPSDLTSAEQATVRKALDSRVKLLRSQADQAIEACAAQMWQNNIFNPVVKQCVQGKAFSDTLVPVAGFKPRNAGAKEPAGVGELRTRLSKNPEDLDGLRELGLKFLDAGDAHVARLVFQRMIELGGGAEEQNLFGVATYKVGDMSGAYAAFASAAQGGSEAGRQNLRKVLQDEGMSPQAQEVLEKFPEGQSGGRSL